MKTACWLIHKYFSHEYTILSTIMKTSDHEDRKLYLVPSLLLLKQLMKLHIWSLAMCKTKWAIF